jgi:hypothetical protein
MLLSIVAALAAVIISGCAEVDAGGDLVPVAGLVTLDGQPLAGASVTFVGTSGESGAGGVAITADDGRYELAHFREGTGAAPGDYKVLISKVVMKDGSPIPAGTESAAELETKDLVPFRYNDYHNSMLKVTVPAAGSSALDFALTSR